MNLTLPSYQVWLASVQVLTTSNITGAIDLAFVDRADIKAFIGPPSAAARYEMLRGCIAELARVRIVAAPPLLPWRQLQVPELR